MKKTVFRHECGILMPVSSLPSPYGIGSFGKGAYDFIDFLAETGQSCWQVLPLNPTSYGDSPYQSPASSFGNPYFIDLDILAGEGLLAKEELRAEICRTSRVDYGALFERRYPALRLAHGRFKENAAFRAFVKRGGEELSDYALFMALKVKNNYRSWTLWDEEYRDIAKARTHASELSREMHFWLWVQYEFERQWQSVRSYAHKNGITVIGDMPIYVAHDSVDVWRSPEEFLLDESFAPTIVAGCPPDAYSEDGQLWGNPIYDWEKMQKDGFLWWCRRVGAAFRLYDVLRIDHFRGFASFYAIPYGDENARRGEWKKAPGAELFDKIKSVYPDAPIIAEDLGFITDDVRELLRYTGFPGMKLLQFAFFDEDSEYLPRTYTTKNCIAYPASHDSDCTRSWYASLDTPTRARFRRETRALGSSSAAYRLIELSHSSIAKLSVVPMQDYLELTNAEGRMNTPGAPEGNWSWRISPRYNTAALRAKVLRLAISTKRASKKVR